MAGSRRVHLTTLARYVPPSSFTSDGREAEIQPDRPANSDTVRLVLNLFEPDEHSFPEFSYGLLVEEERNRSEDKVWLSRLEEERREKGEVASLAKTLEEKYGGKAKKKDRIQDLIDIGYGYDEDDSFIDNSEPYDEFVPASLTTKLGGFYVNSGLLQYRLTSDPEKRKIHLGREKPKKKVCREDGGMKTEYPKASSPSGAKAESKGKKRRKKTGGTLSVTSMLKKFQREKEKGRQMDAAPTTPLCPADAAGGGASAVTDPLLSLIGSTDEQALIQAASAMDLDIDLDSLLEASEGVAGPQPAASPPRFPPNTGDFPQAPPPDAPLQLRPSAASPHQLVCLPDGVPAGLAAAIQRLAAAARSSEGESKLKFFTPEINSLLLDVELQCREHGGQLRSKVYTHLSSFLPCSRDTVLKRVKRLLLARTEEPPQAEGPLQKLKEAVSRAMPEQIARFRESCHVYQQAKASRAEEEREVGQKLNATAEDNLEERGGKRGGPRKMFSWSEEIRECLSQVLKAKVEKSRKEKSSQELEDFLKSLLDHEVKPLWPKGWMQSRALMRESRKLLGLLPSLPVKKVRAEKKQKVDGADLQGSPQMASKKPERRPRAMQAAAGGSAGRPPMTSDPGPSLLNFLAEQALGQEPPLLASQELLVANYTPPGKNWSFALDTRSPPPPPPPPHPSSVELPLSGLYHLLPLGELARPMDAGQASDSTDVPVQ